MVVLTDLPPELLTVIIAETARIWPHLLWKQSSNDFKSLEDDWNDSKPNTQLHHRSDCPTVYQYNDVCTLCTDSRLGFISLTHVSRLFRDITIAMPTLWTNVSDAENPKVGWITIFLARSQDRPLNYSHRVDWELYRREDLSRHLRALYLQALPRIHTLYLAIRGGLPTLDIYSGFLSGAQSLERLVLMRFPAHPLHLPEQFPLIRLRELALPTFDPTSMPWQHDIVRGLTSLRLSFAHMRPVSLTGLLNGLRLLQGLETLYLLKIPVLISDEPSHELDVGSIEFPHLTSLSLHGRARGVMELLNHITAPNVRNVDLVCFKFIAEIKATLTRLTQWVPGLASSHPPEDDFLTASVIHDEANSSLTLALSRMTDAESGPFHFRVKADWEQRWATEGEEDQENLSATDVLKIIVPTIMAPYAASRAKHLSVSLDACWPWGLQDCIVPFTSVSTLSARGSATASCLVELMTRSGTRLSPSTLFPELSMLHARTMQRHLDDHIAAMVKSRAQMGQTIQWRLLS